MAALAAGALTSCTPAEAVPTADGARPATELSITMREVGGSHQGTSTFTLSCDPVGGDLPTAMVACGNLAVANDPFAPVPLGSICRYVIEGRGLITVRGTWDGIPVQAQFDQVNSCEHERFHRLLETLGVS